MRLLDFFIGIELEARDAIRGLKDIDTAGDKAERALKGIGDESEKVSRDMRRMKRESMELAVVARRNFRQAGQEFTAFAQRVDRAADRFDRIGNRLTLGVTVPLALIGRAAFEQARALEELENKTDAVFGEVAADARAAAQQIASDMNRFSGDTQRDLVGFQVLFKKALDPAPALAASEAMTRLVRDTSSLMDVAEEDVFRAFVSGLSGETEPLKRLGVFIRSAEVESRGLAMGLDTVNGRLTEGSKIVARQAIIQEQLADAVGDVARSQGSATEKLKKSQAAWEEFKRLVGQELLPQLTPVIETITEMLRRFNELDPSVRRTIIQVAAFAAILGPVFRLVGFLVRGFALLNRGLGSFFSFLGRSKGGARILAFGRVLNFIKGLVRGISFTPIGRALAALAVIIGVVIAEWDRFKPALERLFNAAKPIFDALYPFFENLLGVVETVVGAIGHLLVDVLIGFLDLVSSVLEGNFAGAWQAIKDIVMGVVQFLETIIVTFFDQIVGDVERTSSILEGAFEGIYNAAKNWLGDRFEQVAETFRQSIRLLADPAGFALDAINGTLGSGQAATSGSAGRGVRPSAATVGGSTTNQRIDRVTVNVPGSSNPAATGRAVVAELRRVSTTIGQGSNS